MRIRHYILIVALVLASRLVPLPSGPPKDIRLFPTLSAQSVGYTGWNNVHSAYTRADFTDGNGVTTLQNIPGLLFYLPANQAVTYRIDCDLEYSQATNVADSFGVTFGISPTNTELWGFMATNATAFASLTPVNITSTAATTVVTGTPAVTTVLGARITGYIENAGNATDNSVQIGVAQATAADVIVVKRDSGCTWHSMN